ncbi:MAG: OmpA family protein [Bacteroidia bacterium]|nr:OmpA family protein [Bacteroidia bacterium]
MRIIFLGILVFLGWLVFGNYWYVCKIREECGVINNSSTPAKKPNSKTKLEIDPDRTADGPVLGKRILSYEVPFAHKSDSILDERELSSLVRDLDNILSEDSSYQKLILVGNTDDDGEAVQNYKIGLMRAIALKDFLVRMGFKEDKIAHRSMGEVNPVLPNNSEINKERNRRIDIYIQP